MIMLVEGIIDTFDQIVLTIPDLELDKVLIIDASLTSPRDFPHHPNHLRIAKR